MKNNVYYYFTVLSLEYNILVLFPSLDTGCNHQLTQYSLCLILKLFLCAVHHLKFYLILSYCGF